MKMRKNGNKSAGPEMGLLGLGRDTDGTEDGDFVILCREKAEFIR